MGGLLLGRLGEGLVGLGRGLLVLVEGFVLLRELLGEGLAVLGWLLGRRLLVLALQAGGFLAAGFARVTRAA